jgi:hypothetical protein
MNKKTTIFFSLGFLWTTIYCQNYFFDVKQVHIKKYVNLEQKAKSVPLDNYGNYQSPSTFKLGQPFRFERKNVLFFPRPIVEYYFSLPDSVVREIKIEFDSLNFPNSYKLSRNVTGNDSSRRQEYFSQYLALKNELTSKFGPPIKTNEFRKIKGYESYYWQATDSWQNDTVSISMYIDFSDRLSKNGTYHVRANVRFMNKDASSSTSKQNSTQDSIARHFLDLIFNEKYSEAWNLVDEEAKRQLTYEKYIESMQPITNFKGQYGKEIKLVSNGLNMQMTGKKSSWYSYNFTTDTEKKILLGIIFLDENSEKIYMAQWKGKLK